MFLCLCNCLLSFKRFLNMFCISFGINIFHLCIEQYNVQCNNQGKQYNII